MLSARSGTHFDEVRSCNLKMILKLVRKRENATKAELSELSGLSFPTVGSILAALVQIGEVVPQDFDSSTGGRPAERFMINPLNTLILVLFIEAGEVQSRLYDSTGKLIDEKKISGSHETCLENALLLIDGFLAEYPTVRFISFGVPAAVLDGKPFHAPDYPSLQDLDLVNLIRTRTGLPSAVENDVNCMVKGYALSRPDCRDLVYIFLGENGPGAGLLNGGCVVKGVSGFAGELGFIPLGAGENFCLAVRSGNSGAMFEAFGKVISILSCVVNPKLVLVAGAGTGESLCREIQKECEKYIPEDRIPECAHAGNPGEDYFSGLLDIAFSEYFDEIEFQTAQMSAQKRVLSKE
jgi:hypothetical protein